ncbi:hypothetical protein [Polaribacter cellanae]|uniref:Uncharacterized protein n=1 Tax=Polaribacter cellanae TaxID=2818493 RepID=A0A975CQA0_9FLAO|nr:hypothetical protein [Polaribacter cellanae]QTE22884.1 hypothetical protein J3359_01010 [Polaribacter cellanae]
MNRVSVIYEYDAIIEKLADDIKNSDFKVQYFLKLLNLKSSFFYKKIREKRFTSEELKLISKDLYPDEFQDYKEELIDKLIEKSKQEIKEGKVSNFEDILQESKIKYGIL